VLWSLLRSSQDLFVSLPALKIAVGHPASKEINSNRGEALPSKGPTTDAIPNMLDLAAMNMGLFLRGTVKPMIVIPIKSEIESGEQ
jgi:hypothetical protein